MSSSTRSSDSVLRFLLRTAVFTVSLFVVLEVFFRIVLPASQWPRGIVAESGIRRFDSTSFTSGRFTYGRYCRGGYSWSINGQGWNSIYEYQLPSQRNGPMIAILGDSYLEGFYVDVEEHLDVLLTEMFDDTISFYTYAMSGAFLSQYIALMKYEIEQYKPDMYVVFVNASDVSRSAVQTSRRFPFYFQYSRDSLGTYRECRPISQLRSWYKDLLLRSALIRYLKVNAKVTLLGETAIDENANIAGNPSGSQDDESTRFMNETADFLLSELHSLDRPVLLVADCPKQWIYEDEDEEAYEDVKALREHAGEYGNVIMIELSCMYRDAYREDGRIFSLEDNPHWDVYTYHLIAQELRPYIDSLLIGNCED